MENSSQEDLKEMKKIEKKTVDGLTRINKYGLCFYIEWKGKEKNCRYLFTRDCDGKDIIEALNKVANNVTEFFYIDAPHHGSDSNHMKEFLGHFTKINNLVFSYCNAATVHKSIEIVSKIEEGKIDNVYFNSTEYQTKLKNRYAKDLEDEMKKVEVSIIEIHFEHFKKCTSIDGKVKKYKNILALDQNKFKNDNIWKEKGIQKSIDDSKKKTKEKLDLKYKKLMNFCSDHTLTKSEENHLDA